MGKHVHVFPVPKGMTPDEAWREITREGKLLDPTVPLAGWSYVRCDGIECEKIEVASD